MLELIIVLTIAAIVSGVALSAVGRSMAATKINRSAAVIAGTLRQAKTTAARRRQPIRVSFDTANRIIHIRNNVTPDSLYQSIYLNASSDVGVTRLSATDTAIVFFPNGLADGPDTITVAATEDFLRRLVMNRAGQIRITTPTP